MCYIGRRCEDVYHSAFTGRTRGYKGEERLAERWCREWVKIDKLWRGLETHQSNYWDGLTTIKAGPPIYLDGVTQAIWKSEINKAVRNCTAELWIPFQNQRLRQRWTALRVAIIDNIKQCSIGQEGDIGVERLRAVGRGIANIIKIRSKVDIERSKKRVEPQWIPPPPKEELNYGNGWKGEERQLGGLKRGESIVPVNSIFQIEEKIGRKRDPIVLLAWAIFGRRRRENFVHRSIIKYVDIREGNGEIFKSRWVNLRKGGSSKISDYKQYRHILYTQKSWVGREEFRMIALLYQIQIRIFQEGNNRGVSNVRCKEQIGHSYGRGVDLLEEQGMWAILRGVEQHRTKVGDREDMKTDAIALHRGGSRLGRAEDSLGVGREVVERGSEMEEDRYKRIGRNKDKEEGGNTRSKDKNMAKVYIYNNIAVRQTEETEERGNQVIREAGLALRDSKKLQRADENVAAQPESKRIETYRKEIERGKGNERVESESENDSIDLVDSYMLHKGIEGRRLQEKEICIEQEHNIAARQIEETEERGKQVIRGGGLALRNSKELQRVDKNAAQPERKRIEIYRKEIERGRGRERVESESENDSVDLVDSHMLYRCIEESRLLEKEICIKHERMRVHSRATKVGELDIEGGVETNRVVGETRSDIIDVREEEGKEKGKQGRRYRGRMRVVDETQKESAVGVGRNKVYSCEVVSSTQRYEPDSKKGRESVSSRLVQERKIRETRSIHKVNITGGAAGDIVEGGEDREVDKRVSSKNEKRLEVSSVDLIDEGRLKQGLQQATEKERWRIGREVGDKERVDRKKWHSYEASSNTQRQETDSEKGRRSESSRVSQESKIGEAGLSHKAKITEGVAGVQVEGGEDREVEKGRSRMSDKMSEISSVGSIDESIVQQYLQQRGKGEEVVQSKYKGGALKKREVGNIVMLGDRHVGGSDEWMYISSSTEEQTYQRKVEEESSQLDKVSIELLDRRGLDKGIQLSKKEVVREKEKEEEINCITELVDRMVLISEVSQSEYSMDLLDRRKLDKCIQLSREKAAREKKGGEEMRNETTEEDNRMRSIREGSQLDKDSIDLVKIRRRSESSRLAQERKTGEGGVIQEGNITGDKVEVGEDKEREKRESRWSDKMSEISSVDLTDESMLQQCLQQKGEGEEVVKSKGGTLKRSELGNIVRLGDRYVGGLGRPMHNGSSIEKQTYQGQVEEESRQSDKDSIDLIDRRRVDKGIQSSKKEVVGEKEREEGINHIIERVDRMFLIGGGRQSDEDSIDLLDRRKLDRGIQLSKVRPVREKKGGEEGRDETMEEGNSIRSISEGSQSDKGSIDLIDRRMLDEYMRSLRENEGRNGIGYETTEVGDRTESRSVGEYEGSLSEKDSIDLVDSKMLEECMQLSNFKAIREKEGECNERDEMSKETTGTGDRMGLLSVGGLEEEGYFTSETGESRTLRGIPRQRENTRTVQNYDKGTLSMKLGELSEGKGNRRKGSNLEKSDSITSSIAGLFRDAQLEKEGKKIGNKHITRRKVWERWKGVVRGSIRREIRKKKKVDQLEERGRQDTELVFDYTAKGQAVDEVKLLGKGEAFCIVDYKIDEDRSKVDIYQYQRRLRLHEVFRDPGSREGDEIQETQIPLGRVGNRIVHLDRERRSSVRREVDSSLNTQGRGGRESIVSMRRRGGGDIRGSGAQSIVGRVSRTPRRGLLDSERRSSVRREVDSTPNTQERGGRESAVSMRRRGGGDRRDSGVQSIVGRLSRTPRRTLDSNIRRRGSGVVTQGREVRCSVATQSREGRRSGVGTRSSGGRDLEPLGTQSRRRSIVDNERVDMGEREGRRLPSMYDPDSKNRNLHRYNTCIQEEIILALEDKKVKFRDNIPKKEREALKALKQRIEEKEIIITRADKGSRLVAVDYDKYISKGTHYIEEEAGAYSKVQETEEVIIGKLTKERNKIAEELKDRGVIGVQTAAYVKKQLEEKITGIKFYYKIHKDRRIDSMPLRPLQSCIKTPMQHLSIVLTDILQPLLTDRNIPSFIFDSNQLLYRLKKLGKIPSNCTLISSDVSALYPSIPHDAGFKAMGDFLQKYTMYNTQQIASLLRALELVITDNYMTWNNQIYRQTSGVAMGTPVAVAYANIFMNWVDREVRCKAPYIYEHIRYIDDNLFILPGDKVEQLMEIANNVLPPYIKFTYERLEASSDKGLPFLDTQLFIGVDNNIESRLYTKATDRHAYLLPSSYHPPHITRNIPLAVFGRLRKICSREEWFVEDGQKAVGWLENRGYDKREIQKAAAKTRLKDRWSMIEKIENNRKKDMKRKEGTDIDIPLIMTYNQHVGKIRQILKDRQPLLDSAFNRTKVRPRLSFRRKRNLSDIIVQKGLRGPIENNRKKGNVFTKCSETPGYRSRCPCKGKHS